MAVSDTSPEVEARQLAIRRAMTPEQRLLVALGISEFCRELKKVGIRRDHPEWSERQIMIELFRLAFLPQPLAPGCDERR
jgi:hypothetical protein